LKTIEKVFAWRLRDLRGKRTQQQVSDETKIPLRTYQTMEDGRIPKKKANLEAIAKYYGVPETFLFIDPDLKLTGSTPVQSPTIESLTRVIEDQEKRLHEFAKYATDPLFMRIHKCSDDEKDELSKNHQYD
jgi:transcriptional regulator with XRE-family HTH domain